MSFRKLIPAVALTLLAFARAAAKDDPSVQFFAEQVPRMEIRLDAKAANSLRNDPRTYVLGTVIEGGVQYTNVSIHLKGAAGSMRHFDDRPGLTLNFNRAAKGQKFHGLEKLHLNNSVQDGSLMTEMICADLYRAAGVPTARATHAVVQINNRKLGLYVLKEGYDEEFLKRNFKRTDGNLYDGGFLNDIDQPLKLDEGKTPVNHEDLKALFNAAYERDLPKRQQRLDALLDMDRFLSFVALNMLTCDWDGYVAKPNNYRLYFNPESGKAVFIPHGMDQMFWWTDYPILPNGGGGLVSRQLLEVPAFRARYYERLEELTKDVLTAERLTNSVNRIVGRLRKNLAADLPQLVDQIALQSGGMQSRLMARVREVQEQLGSLPKPLKYDADGSAAIVGWQPRPDAGKATLHSVREPSQPERLLIRGGEGQTIASWRAKMRLPAGNYRFVARVTTKNVEPLGGTLGSGAGLRLSGGSQSETSRVIGTVKNKELHHAFRVEAERDIEFVAELRATKGEVLFDLDSLRLLKR